jgi:RNA polymerase sigma-70 factor, ECF subfamily
MTDGLGRLEIPPELIRRLQSEEPAAFDEFFALLGPRVMNFGMRMCGEREDARDVLQETFLKALESVKDLRNPEAVRSWLFRIAANACLMKRRRSKFLKEEVELDESVPETGEMAQQPFWAALPDRALEDAELRAQIRDAVLGLQPIYRSVLVMRDMEGMDTEDVAAALGVSRDVVKMRLHRARTKVKETLAPLLRRGRGSLP